MSNKRVSAIIIKKEKILLIHRIKPGTEYFVLPGGSVEASENNRDALLREVKEETGLDENCGKLIMNMTSGLSTYI